MHALILDGAVVKRHDFGPAAPPVLAPHKGKWVTIIEEPKPDFDMATQVIDRHEVVGAGQVTVGWTVRAKTADERRPGIIAALAAIDAASARPLRAIAAGTATQADNDRLTELEAQAAALRAEMASLPTTA